MYRFHKKTSYFQNKTASPFDNDVCRVGLDSFREAGKFYLRFACQAHSLQILYRSETSHTEQLTEQGYDFIDDCIKSTTGNAGLSCETEDLFWHLPNRQDLGQ